MIPCQKCGNINPLGTTFCRSCGVRVEVNINQVMSSVAHGNAEKRDLDVLEWGRSAVTLCGFLLVVSLIVRHAVVPKPLPADLNRVTDPSLFTVQPAWAETAVPVANAVGGVDISDLKPSTTRLSWRAAQGGPLLSAFSLELKPIRDSQQSLLKQQKPDGSVPGPNPAACTALATLVWQAWPSDPTLIAAADKARSWLIKEWATVGRNPIARALAVAALADAEALTTERRSSLGVLLVDGSSPMWQTFALFGLATADRPSEFVALDAKLDGHWKQVLALLGQGELAGTNDIKYWFSEYATRLELGEDRLAWATLTWMHPLSPNDLAGTLRGWAGSKPAPVSPDLAKACGDIAPPAVLVLTLTAPLRIPALQLSR